MVLVQQKYPSLPTTQAKVHLEIYLIKTWTNTDLCLWLKPNTLRSLPSPSISGGGSPVIRSSVTTVTGKRSLKITISFRRTKEKYTLKVELLSK
jgi:hypothetical protein